MFTCVRDHRAIESESLSVDDGVLYVRVAGVSFHQESLAACSAGEAVRFIHEPDNPHDELALRVETASGETIGYVPRGSWLRRAIHQDGRGVCGIIASVGMGRACLLGALLSVTLSDDDVRTASYFPGSLPPDPPPGGFRYWISNPASSEHSAEAPK
ncbi:HIRAN domain-containing protein [Sphingomonas morindae]|uniref:HIRAN domain-containing protein n=1 Tax=Sphingomonas morindae TaxID=1541170 RepID=A0ABY4XCI4_9SPHN|nr:HIRAN domain-containing protein [Sphingomonas morindae]